MILVTGIAGFTGRFVRDLLIQRRLPFKCLVRNPGTLRELSGAGISCVEGDVRDPSSYRKALVECQGIINLVSFAEEHVPLLLSEATRAGVRRVLFIGTTAMFTGLNAASKAMRYRAESAVSQSGLDWTILRPTMIYGARGDRNMERLIRVIRRFRIHPILGKGDRLIQPIHVRDLSRAILDAYHCTGAYERAFNLSGRNALTYRQAVEVVARRLGVSPFLFPMPLWAAILAARVASRIPGFPRIKPEQVLRLNEDKAFSHQDAVETWGFESMDFESGIRMECDELGFSAASKRSLPGSAERTVH